MQRHKNTLDPENGLMLGQYTGFQLINKFGRNPDVDNGTQPEDIWDGGGIYTGFPTTAEVLQAVSANSGDTGQLTVQYLADSTSKVWQNATVTLNGTTPVDFPFSAYRVHTAQYNNGSSTGFNLGAITVRHKVTTANIFCVIPIGRSQSAVGAFTVPAGQTAYVKKVFCRIIGSVVGQIDAALWVRQPSQSPRLRRPFSCSDQSPFEDKPYGGIALVAGTDISVRALSSLQNNLDIVAGFDLIMVGA